MEVVIIVLTMLLFALGWLWLKYLQARVSAAQAVKIRAKYFGWIPISFIMLGFGLLHPVYSRLVHAGTLFIGWWQVGRICKRHFLTPAAIAGLIFLAAAASVFYFARLSQSLLLLVIFGSVLADITAYSISALAPHRHYLPAWINAHKSYEGVVGEVLGSVLALILFWLVGLAEFTSSVILFAVVVGLGCAVGDLTNSFIKRQMGISDWGEIFPGHGGIFDRFSSFYFAYAFATLFLQTW